MLEPVLVPDKSPTPDYIMHLFYILYQPDTALRELPVQYLPPPENAEGVQNAISCDGSSWLRRLIV